MPALQGYKYELDVWHCQLLDTMEQSPNTSHGCSEDWTRARLRTEAQRWICSVDTSLSPMTLRHHQTSTELSSGGRDAGYGFAASIAVVLLAQVWLALLGQWSARMTSKSSNTGRKRWNVLSADQRLGKTAHMPFRTGTPIEGSSLWEKGRMPLTRLRTTNANPGRNIEDWTWHSRYEGSPTQVAP